MQELEKDEGKGNKGENQEEEENVVAKEEVIGLVVGVIEPEGLGEGEIPAKGGLGGGEGVKGQHWVEETAGEEGPRWDLEAERRSPAVDGLRGGEKG